MGLDVTAYRQLELVEDPKLGADGEPEKESEIKFYVNPYYPERQEGVEPGAVYRYADEFSFRAGSYSGYNEWRDQLAQMAGYPLCKYARKLWDGSIAEREDYASSARTDDPHVGPFFELIRFSDCEGTLGPGVCARLLEDFKEWGDKYLNQCWPGWFWEAYQNWKKAVEFGADGGAVSFH